MITEESQKPLFSAEMTLTKEMYAEYAKKVCVTLGVKRRIWLYIFAALEAALGVLLLFLDTDLFYPIIIFAFAIAIAFTARFSYLFSINPMYKQIVSLRGENPQSRVDFFEDYVLETYSEGEHRFDYSKITRIISTKHLICLMVGTQKRVFNGICVEKSKLENGTFPELVSFFVTKGFGSEVK